MLMCRLKHFLQSSVVSLVACMQPSLRPRLNTSTPADLKMYYPFICSFFPIRSMRRSSAAYMVTHFVLFTDAIYTSSGYPFKLPIEDFLFKGSILRAMTPSTMATQKGDTYLSYNHMQSAAHIRLHNNAVALCSPPYKAAHACVQELGGLHTGRLHRLEPQAGELLDGMALG